MIYVTDTIMNKNTIAEGEAFRALLLGWEGQSEEEFYDCCNSFDILFNRKASTI